MKCQNCSKEVELLSNALPYCKECIKLNKNNVLDKINKIHQQVRRRFNMTEEVSKSDNGVRCKICANECNIKPNEYGFCMTRKNENNKLTHIADSNLNGILHYYYDPLPTNCVADWVCEEGSRKTTRIYGYTNLAVFYGSCSFNCLFCQNWHYRELIKEGNIRKRDIVSAQQLANACNETVRCICFFGGDPSTQIIHAIKVSQMALKKNNNLRICFETNGNINERFLDKIAELSFTSGGCIKFDLKAYNENLNKALCGISNKATLSNFKKLSELSNKRWNFLVASTLLVPYYVDYEEVYEIAQFISSLNNNIPYSLLAFYPCFYLNDLPTTSRMQAIRCEEKAKECGLKNVRVGNLHLLS